MTDKDDLYNFSCNFVILSKNTFPCQLSMSFCHSFMSELKHCFSDKSDGPQVDFTSDIHFCALPCAVDWRSDRAG